LDTTSKRLHFRFVKVEGRVKARSLTSESLHFRFVKVEGRDEAPGCLPYDPPDLDGLGLQSRGQLTFGRLSAFR
jgi:hypothetical protein